MSFSSRRKRRVSGTQRLLEILVGRGAISCRRGRTLMVAERIKIDMRGNVFQPYKEYIYGSFR
jgi:hypothetical protein